jgi:hypothetical protein
MMFPMPEDDDFDPELQDEEEETENEIYSDTRNCNHSYSFVEPLQCGEPEIYLEKWRCLYCSCERVLRIHIGVRGD